MSTVTLHITRCRVTHEERMRTVAHRYRKPTAQQLQTVELALRPSWNNQHNLSEPQLLEKQTRTAHLASSFNISSSGMYIIYLPISLLWTRVRHLHPMQAAAGSWQLASLSACGESFDSPNGSSVWLLVLWCAMIGQTCPGGAWR